MANRTTVEKYLEGIKHEISSEGGNTNYCFGAECRTGKSYSVRITITEDDDCGVQCGFPLVEPQGAAVDEVLSHLNRRLHENRAGVTVFVEDGCAIASTGTSGECLDEQLLSTKLTSVLETASQLDTFLSGKR